MEIKFRIKPIKYVADTKQGLIEAMMSSGRGVFCYSVSRYGIGRKDIRNPIWKFYNIEKRRKKNHNHETIVCKGHWVGYCYTIPESIMIGANIRIEQKARNFIIKSL